MSRDIKLGLSVRLKKFAKMILGGFVILRFLEYFLRSLKSQFLAIFGGLPYIRIYVRGVFLAIFGHFHDFWRFD
jgi:hypothetical protein